MLVRNAVYVTFTSDMTIVFFYSIIQTSAGFFYLRKVTISSGQNLLQTMFCFNSDGILSLGCIKRDLRVLATLKMACTLMYERFF